MEINTEQERRIFDRKRVQERAQFFVGLASREALLVDTSDGGVRLDIKGPVRVQVRLKVNGIESDYDATLAWTKNYSDGRMGFGLEFSHNDLERLYGEAHR